MVRPKILQVHVLQEMRSLLGSTIIIGVKCLRFDFVSFEFVEPSVSILYFFVSVKVSDAVEVRCVFFRSLQGPTRFPFHSPLFKRINQTQITPVFVNLPHHIIISTFTSVQEFSKKKSLPSGSLSFGFCRLVFLTSRLSSD